MERKLIEGVRVLTQDFVPNTNAYVILSVGLKRKVIVTALNIVNTSSGSDKFSLFLGKGANTYANSSALNFNQALAANTAVQITFGDTGLPLGGVTDDKLAIQCANANVFTVTVMGVEL